MAAHVAELVVPIRAVERIRLVIIHRPRHLPDVIGAIHRVFAGHRPRHEFLVDPMQPRRRIESRLPGRDQGRDAVREPGARRRDEVIDVLWPEPGAIEASPDRLLAKLEGAPDVGVVLAGERLLGEDILERHHDRATLDEVRVERVEVAAPLGRREEPLHQAGFGRLLVVLERRLRGPRGDDGRLHDVLVV